MSEDTRAADAAHGLFRQGVANMAAGEQEAALMAFRQVLAADPALLEAHVNLGLLLADSDAAQAERHYRAAVDLDPWRLEPRLHLGALLAAAKRFEEAELQYRHALILEPESAAALSNLGVLLACTGREREAAACYRAAIAAAPDFQSARFNLSYLLLRDGDYAAGWRAFEGRPWYAQLDAWFGLPRWDGQDLAGKALLIGIEAGHGDMIQFCRYAALAKQGGAARVGIVCHAGLARLFATLDGVDAVFAHDRAAAEGWSGWDSWIAPLSMPLRFGTLLDTIPAALPYLRADPGDLARLRPALGAGDGIKVGLAWQGNPRFENDADRSIAALATLAPLAQAGGADGAEGARFFSLQLGAGELARLDAGARACFPGLTDLAPHIGDFADTAALIECLDLVITVDTAVAHLAGALGKPCWVLLPAHKTDWRWLKEREDSPWYPGAVRLFRQAGEGGNGWDGVIAAVALALRQRIGAR